MTSPAVKDHPRRPKGLPKTGGRKKGTPNKVTSIGREQIMQADPIGFLIDVMQGKPKESVTGVDEHGKPVKALVFPTMEQRKDAAIVLSKKILPDLKAIEHSGNIGATQEQWLKLLK